MMIHAFFAVTFLIFAIWVTTILFLPSMRKNSTHLLFTALYFVKSLFYFIQSSTEENVLTLSFHWFPSHQTDWGALVLMEKPIFHLGDMLLGLMFMISNAKHVFLRNDQRFVPTTPFFLLGLFITLFSGNVLSLTLGFLIVQMGFLLHTILFQHLKFNKNKLFFSWFLTALMTQFFLLGWFWGMDIPEMLGGLPMKAEVLGNGAYPLFFLLVLSITSYSVLPTIFFEKENLLEWMFASFVAACLFFLKILGPFFQQLERLEVYYSLFIVALFLAFRMNVLKNTQLFLKTYVFFNFVLFSLLGLVVTEDQHIFILYALSLNIYLTFWVFDKEINFNPWITYTLLSILTGCPLFFMETQHFIHYSHFLSGRQLQDHGHSEIFVLFYFVSQLLVSVALWKHCKSHCVSRVSCSFSRRTFHFILFFAFVCIASSLVWFNFPLGKILILAGISADELEWLMPKILFSGGLNSPLIETEVENHYNPFIFVLLCLGFLLPVAFFLISRKIALFGKIESLLMRVKILRMFPYYKRRLFKFASRCHEVEIIGRLQSWNLKRQWTFPPKLFTEERFEKAQEKLRFLKDVSLDGAMERKINAICIALRNVFAIFYNGQIQFYVTASIFLILAFIIRAWLDWDWR